MDEKEDKKVADAPGAEMVVRRALDTQYADKLKNVKFRKAWYSSEGKQEFWDVEGNFELKKGNDKKRNFRYQVDPWRGNILGYEEIPIK